MAEILPVDHHATFAGWNADNTRFKNESKPWSTRKRVGFIVVSALTSWIFVLSPFLLFN